MPKFYTQLNLWQSPINWLGISLLILSLSFQYFRFTLLPKLYGFFQRLPAFLLIVKIKTLTMRLLGWICPCNTQTGNLLTFSSTCKCLTNTVITRLVVPKWLFSKRFFWLCWILLLNLPIIILCQKQRFPLTARLAISKKLGDNFVVAVYPDQPACTFWIYSTDTFHIKITLHIIKILYSQIIQTQLRNLNLHFQKAPCCARRVA